MVRPRPRIGIFDATESYSGITRYVNGLLDALAGSEFDVTLFCHPRTPYAPRPGVRLCPVSGGAPLLALGQKTEPKTWAAAKPAARSLRSRLWRSLVPSGIRYATGYVRSAARLAREIRAESIDLLHTNECGCMESVLASRLAGVPRVLATYHTDSSYGRLQNRLTTSIKVLDRFANRLLDRAISVSECTRLDRIRYARAVPSRVVTIHNGIDPAPYDHLPDARTARAALNLPPDRIVIGAVGQLNPFKGYDVLLRAFARVAPAHPTADLAVAGTGACRGELESLARELGIESRVRFLGFQSDVPLVLAALDVYVMASRCEALPYALLEAMAAKLPIVATTVGGIPEVIEHGRSGLLVPPGRADALSAALHELLGDRQRWSRIGTAARERIDRRFHQRDSARDTVAVYRQMLNGRPAPLDA